MCDQANHDNCEIIDDLHLTITNLEMTIADLKAEIVEDLEKDWCGMIWQEVLEKIEGLKKKWEGK